MADPTVPSKASAPDVTIQAGVLGKFERLPTGEGAYPPITTDVVKILRERGLTVEYAEERRDRRDVSHHSAEILVPVLVFAQQVTWEAAKQYVENVIGQLFPPARLSRSNLNVKVGRISANGETHWFEANGKGPDVLKAMKEAGPR